MKYEFFFSYVKLAVGFVVFFERNNNSWKKKRVRITFRIKIITTS